MSKDNNRNRAKDNNDNRAKGNNDNRPMQLCIDNCRLS